MKLHSSSSSSTPDVVLPDDYNLTADEISILAPKQNPVSGAFKGSVALGATVFFIQKIFDSFPKAQKLIPENIRGYALLAGLIGGGVSGALTTNKTNAQIEKFTKRLEDAEQRYAASQQNLSR